MNSGKVLAEELVERVHQAAEDEIKFAMARLAGSLGASGPNALETYLAAPIRARLNVDLAKLAKLCDHVFQDPAPPPPSLSPEDEEEYKTIDANLIRLTHAVERARAEDRVLSIVITFLEKANSALRESLESCRGASAAANVVQFEQAHNEAKRMRGMDETLRTLGAKLESAGPNAILHHHFALVRGPGSGTTTRDLLDLAARVDAANNTSTTPDNRRS